MALRGIKGIRAGNRAQLFLATVDDETQLCPKQFRKEGADLDEVDAKTFQGVSNNSATLGKPTTSSDIEQKPEVFSQSDALLAVTGRRCRPL